MGATGLGDRYFEFCLGQNHLKTGWDTSHWSSDESQSTYFNQFVAWS